MPKPYTSRVRNALAAAPEAVDLRNLGGGGGAFYAGGLRLDGLYVEARHLSHPASPSLASRALPSPVPAG